MISQRFALHWTIAAAVGVVALLPLAALWIIGALDLPAAGLAALGALLLAVAVGLWLGRRKSAPATQSPSGSPPAVSAGGDGDALTLEWVARAAGMMTAPTQLYRWLTRQLADQMGAQRCALILRHLDKEDAFQVAMPAYGFSQEATRELHERVEAAGSQLAGMQTPAAFNSFEPDREPTPLPGEHNALLSPLFSGDRLVGCVRLANKRGGFTAQDGQVLERLTGRLAVILENAHLYQVTQRRLEEMSLLYEIGMPLSGESDFDQAVGRALQAIQAGLGCEQVNLFLVDEGNETLFLHNASPYRVVGNGDARVLLGDGVIGRVAETGEMALVADLATLRDAVSLLPGARSELCVPLKLGSWVIGVLDAQSGRPGAFDDKEVRLLEIVAGQLATALQSARLYEATRQRAAELSQLYDVTVAVSSAELDLAGIVALVMQRLITVTRVDGGRLALWDSPTNSLITRFATGPTLIPAAKGRASRSGVENFMRNHLLGSRKPLALYRDDPTLGEAIAQAMSRGGIQSVLILPLVAHNRLVGLVELAHQAEFHRFSPEEIRLAQTLATQAGIALENARLYQETKQAVQELAALQALALDITAQLSLPELVDRLLMRAQNLVNAAGGVIYLLEPQLERLVVAASDLPWGEGVMAAGRRLAQHVVEDVRPLSQTVALSIVDAPDLSLSCGLVPLRWREQVVGVMGVFRPEADEPFAAQEMYLLELLAPQAAIAVRNVQLFEALELRMSDLQRAQANLVQAEKAAAIGRLAASLAHEINNPLQSLNNCLHLSRHPDLPPDKRGVYLGMAQEEVERLMAIVNRMLNFYRPATGETRSATDVNLLLNDVLALVGRQLEHSSIVTEQYLDPKLPYVLAIPNNLRQVFLNLILNAVDAMPNGGRLTIATNRPDNRHVGITIGDTGRGIPADDLARIYEPFFTTKELGTGLGLAITYGIVEAHDGRIQVESVVGQGTKFMLQFPIGEEAAEQI